VRERLRHDGRIETPLDLSQVREAARALRAAGARSIAVCFLYCYVDPRHEETARRIVEEECTSAFVTCSHEVAPEFREYERLSTVVVNAYLGPVLAGYLERLGPRLREVGITAPPHITQSNGGVMSFETARVQPVRTVLSGPATGVVGGLQVGRAAGFRDLITFDMGGTSTDVSLIADGRPKLAGEMEVHGYPLKTPALDIHTVGAGGGSIAFIDSGGLLKVGPRSSGAAPGPVCYGLGNEEPTVTDANVVLGTLNPEHLLGGRMKIDRARAEAAIERLGARLGLDVMTTAQGIVSIVTANMARAIRVISVQRGHDPRDYTLMAFGGAGPLHAARLARELEIGRVLVPANPGILCAMGLLLTDLRADFALTRLLPATEASTADVAEAFAALSQRADRWFEHETIASSHRRLARTVDMRYHGQNYELSVALPDGAITPATMQALLSGFADVHRQRYGFAADGDPVQLVTLRVEATGTVRKAELLAHPDAGPDASAAIVHHRPVWLAETRDFATTPIYARDALRPGNRFAGPAIVEQMDATTLVPPGTTARVDAYLNLILEATA
jgi:N-methylhydantoinase A